MATVVQQQHKLSKLVFSMRKLPSFKLGSNHNGKGLTHKTQEGCIEKTAAYQECKAILRLSLNKVRLDLRLTNKRQHIAAIAILCQARNHSPKKLFSRQNTKLHLTFLCFVFLSVLDIQGAKHDFLSEKYLGH